MSSNNDINFGPVFMRGRKPVSGTKTPTSVPGNDGTPILQARKPSGGSAPALRPLVPPLGSFSSVSISPAPHLSKSFSAVVSPEKEDEDRPTFSGTSNGWDLSHAPYDDAINHINAPGNLLTNGIGSAHHEYSRETLLSLYSEALALKLPLDLDTSDPAFTETPIGPPLGLIEMTDTEKELFAGPFNSERRVQTNKTQHHNHSENQATSISTGGLTRLSIGNGAKIGKHHSPIERFNSLGIQGGVLAGVASPTHTLHRRQGDSENDPPEGTRRFPRLDEPTLHSSGWSGNPGGRRNRDSGPPADGKWKRGVPLEEKMQSMESAPGGNHKYSVLDRMREKAAASLDQATRELSAQGSSSNDAPEPPDQLHDQSDRLSSSRAARDFENNKPDVSSATPLDGSSAPEQDSKSIREPLIRESVSSTKPDQADTRGTSNASALVTSVNTAPEDIAWQYRDPSGTVQGPFTAFQMQEWYKGSFFRDDLLVKRVSDIAFETLETLLLRIGDREKPFLVRPPPVLPPNLPLPIAHAQAFQTSHPAQSPSITQRSTLQEPSSFPGRQENFSVFDSTHVAANPDIHSLHVSSALDPWNSSAPSPSPLHRAGTLPSSSPLITTSGGWLVDLPALSQPLPQNTNDYNASLISNGFVSTPFGQPDPRRFLHHVPHPTLVGPNSGYPYSLPMPHQPAFGQIPVGHHLFNGAGLDPLMASQLHPHLGFAAASYRGNSSMNSSADLVEAPVEPERHEQLSYAQPAASADPWHMQHERVPPGQAQMLERSSLQQSVPMSTNNVDPAPPAQKESWTQPAVASLEPIGTRSSGKNTPTSVSQELLPPTTLQASHPFDNTHTSPTSMEAPTTLPPANSTVTPLSPSGSMQPSISLSSSEKKRSLGAEDKSVLNPNQPRNAPVLQSEQVSVHSLDRKAPPQAEVSASDEAWQTVVHHPATKASPPPSTVANAPAPVKQTGKVIVISRAQQDEQDRRKASIAKTQQQLKEAQAIERAAREASEAAATAVTVSNSPSAPWSTDDNKAVALNLSLTEIQAIESKQSEKRRQAEKLAAANRALAEQAVAADRTAKFAKESLPATSNWAASSSPTKLSGNTSAPAVWGGKESDGSVSSGPKQTMKQIQEEEARRKKLAQQQLVNKSAASARPSGGYAGSVGTAAAKPAVSGPWSVVGAKTKVNAPPMSGNRQSPAVSVVPGLPANTRAGKSANPAKSNASVSNNRSSATSGSNPSKVNIGGSPSTAQVEGPPSASPEFMKWLREALRGMNNVDDFVKMLLDFPINPDESVLEIVSDSVYAGSATLDGRRFAKEFNIRRHADVMARMNNPSKQAITNRVTSSSGGGSTKKTSTMADAVKSQPVAKNDGWGFAVVGAKKKKK